GGVGATGVTTGYVVKDSNGLTLGAFDAYNPNTFPPSAGALRNVAGRIVHVSANISGLNQGLTYFYYTSAGCTGSVLYSVDGTSLVAPGTVVGTTVYFPQTSGVSTSISSILGRSQTFTDQSACDAYYGVGNSTFLAPDGCCQVAAFTGTVA